MDDDERDRIIELEAKLSKILDLMRAWRKGEPAEAVLINIGNVIGDLPLVDEPTWAYSH